MWQIVVLIVTISAQQPYASMTFTQGYVSEDDCHAAIPSIRRGVNQLLRYPGTQSREPFAWRVSDVGHCCRISIDFRLYNRGRGVHHHEVRHQGSV